jgi:hypothetical protein
MALPSILQLPDELVLQVLNHIPGIPRDKQQDILNLSLTCKRFRPICIETLLVHPILKLSKVAQLVHRYSLNPSCIRKVQTLEIISATTKSDQSRMIESMRPVTSKGHSLFSVKTQRFYSNIISSCTSSPQQQEAWIKDLAKCVLDAYLGILLVMLPNLHSLLLGPNFLSHYPIFNPMICDRNCERGGVLWALEPYIPYLDDVLNHLRQKLTSLELPVLWNIKDTVYSPQKHFQARYIQNHLAPISQQSLPHFTHLRELTLPCFAFGQYRAIRPMWDMHATSVLPPSLKTLRIVDAQHVPLGYFLRPVLESATSLPSLKRVEVYFHDHEADPGCTKREERLQVHARNAHIDLSIWHPKSTRRRLMVKPDVETIFDTLAALGQPWRYGEKGSSEA